MRALTDKSRTTFIGGKKPFLLAAATDLRGRGAQNAIPRLPFYLSPPKVVMPSAGGRTFGGNGATDMAGAVHKTPSPGQQLPEH
jgi:hypothetical protein